MARELLLRHRRYEAHEMLGRGAQGVVLRVVDREAPSLALVAKLYARSRFSADLLKGEFALLSRLHIAGLVRAHDFGRDEETLAPFLVEDYVDGPDAPEWVLGAAAETKSPPEQGKARRLEELLACVARTLSELHDAGFVHGDIKPAHVRVARAGPVLLDLGAAVSCRAGSEAAGAVGFSRGYAAPEVIAGARPTPASDLYGLGALAWAVATGRTPGGNRTGDALRGLSPWVRPSVAELIAILLADHPQDRPSTARDVLRQLGAASVASMGARSVEPPVRAGRLIGYEKVLERLAKVPPGVTYLTGPAGSGKSHVLRELVTRELLGGRDARLVTPAAQSTLVSGLIDFFSACTETWPFVTGRNSELVLAIDELEALPEELRTAIETFRCRPSVPGFHLIAAVRSAPSGAPEMRLPALDEAALVELCAALGEHDEARQREVIRIAQGRPGWLVAALGRVPLTKDAALENLRALSEKARTLLAVVATVTGDVPADVCGEVIGSGTAAAVSELLSAGLIMRRGAAYTLSVPALAADLASALGTFEVVDALADVLLGKGARAARILLVTANASNPPGRRAELLSRAAAQAHAEGLRSFETEALLALAADPRERKEPVLRALERLTRGSGNPALYPQVLAWLEEGRENYPRLGSLALRRRADRLARDGRYAEALGLIAEAQRLATADSDRTEEGLALALRGAVALYQADWAEAGRVLAEARTALEECPTDDSEELARLDHNVGVVCLYQEQVDEAIQAFERSLGIKRSLGDRGGVCACLLNLGLALGKASRYAEASAALDEATALARSLGQAGSAGWCLAARAEVEIHRRDARAAERFVAEAEALGSDLAAPVRADLRLARAEVALLDGNGHGAVDAVRQLDAGVRADDSLIDARALVIEAEARLLVLPVDRRSALRASARAARRARTAGLREIERRALEVLRRARRAPGAVTETGSGGRRAPPFEKDDVMTDSEKTFWQWLDELGGGKPVEQAAVELAALVVRQAGAERAFVGWVSDAGTVVAAWGADVDGLPLGDAASRVDRQAVETALRSGAPFYQREIETAGGRGSRLTVAAGAMETSRRPIVVAEHRFAPARFDDVRQESACRWASLAALIGRLASADERAAPPSASVERTSSTASEIVAVETTTSLPARIAPRAFPTIIGTSRLLENALSRLEAAITSELPVLVTGETGVGKELFARAVHDYGRRQNGPFVAVSCAAIPETLFEAELFGHAKGSFTGAERARAGLIAQAEKGTLFLDEVGELPLSRQAVLLRALESRTYRSVGSDADRRFDVRIVAATNRDLARSVREGAFRRDLLYRLNVLPIHVPPLRERAEDIAPLVRHFLFRAGSKSEFSESALAALEAHDWPGNVRELEHQVQRLTALGVPMIERAQLPRQIRARGARATSRAKPPSRLEDPKSERARVERALAATGGNITHAAERLGITRHGLKKRMARLGMRGTMRAAKLGRQS